MGLVYKIIEDAYAVTNKYSQIRFGQAVINLLQTEEYTDTPIANYYIESVFATEDDFFYSTNNTEVLSYLHSLARKGL